MGLTTKTTTELQYLSFTGKIIGGFDNYSLSALGRHQAFFVCSHKNLVSKLHFDSFLFLFSDSSILTNGSRLAISCLKPVFSNYIFSFRSSIYWKGHSNYSMDVINRYITIKTHVDGAPRESDFELKASSLALSLDPASNDVIVKNLYVSIDPYQINRMKSFSSSQKAISYAVAITPGEAIDAYGVGKVVASGNPEFEKGDFVAGLLNWGEYTVIKAGSMLNKLNPMGFPLSYHVGILGFSGLTAYVGFFEICKPKKGEKVFVSAASGSVGNLVGQFAKLFGCYVVGCAGSNEKVALLKEKLGFDEAFNYREETDLKSTLKKYFPDGIDIYFDNVGGEMQEAAIDNMNINGRIAVCGVISEYTAAEKRAVPSMIDVIYKRIKIQGFLSGDYLNLFADFLSTISDHLLTGKIQPLEDISDGVESIPSAFIGLFCGQNIGKKIVKIAEE